MVSHRRKKKEARQLGLNEPELEMVELLEEVLERFRWLQVLSHAQGYLLRQKLSIPDAELDKVLEAATRAIDKDATWLRWQEGLGRLKGQVLEGRRGIRRERRQMNRETRRGGAGPAGGDAAQAGGGAAEGGAS